MRMMRAGRRLRLLGAALAVLAGCRGEPAHKPPPVAVLADAAVAVTPVVDRPAIPADWRYPTTGTVARSTRAMVVSEHALATQVGVDVLAAGGNAYDAAVAVAFALAVVYPEAGNLGGGGFAVLRTAEGVAEALDFRETAPGAATADMYLDAKGAPVRLKSITGGLASGVPGTVAGLWAMHGKHGTRPWKELLAPAVRLARDGFVVNARMVYSLGEHAERFAEFPASVALFLPGGKPPTEGSVWKNPDLAATLERIAAQGEKGFYAGATAAAIVAEMKRTGGIITARDLLGYRVVWRAPIEFRYRGLEVLSMPAPSSGGVVLALMAALLEPYSLRELGWHSAEHLHLLAEASRRAYAERNYHLGDPDFEKLPIEALIGAKHVAELRATIDPARATPSSKVVAAPIESEHTTHFAVVDAAGNVASVTYTLNALYGSAVTVTGAGFLMNDEMDDFSVAPGVPNEYELVQGARNRIAPGKRMLSSMAPTIVVDATGKAVLVLGGRGGSRIITSVFEVMSNVVDFGMDVEAAVNAPRVHHQHLPDVLFYEEHGLGAHQVDALAAKGHKLKELPLPQEPIGITPTIVRKAGVWTSVADPRRGGQALGL